MPAVSVITTVYNDESFIEGSVSSILNQSFRDFEHIVVNDGFIILISVGLFAVYLIRNQKLTNRYKLVLLLISFIFLL